MKPYVILNEEYPRIILRMLSNPYLHHSLIPGIIWGVYLLFKLSHEHNTYKQNEEINRELMLHLKMYLQLGNAACDDDILSSFKYFTLGRHSRLLFFLKHGFMKEIMKCLGSKVQKTVKLALSILLILTRGSYKEIEVVLGDETLLCVLFQAFNLHNDTPIRYIILQIFINIVVTSKALGRLLFFKGGAQFLLDHVNEFTNRKVLEPAFRLISRFVMMDRTLIPHIIDKKLAHTAFDFVAQNVQNAAQAKSVVEALNTCAVVLEYLKIQGDNRLDDFLQHIGFFASLEPSHKSTVQVFEIVGVIRAQFDPDYQEEHLYQEDSTSEEKSEAESSLIDL